MRLWTIQTVEAYEILQKDGVLHSVGLFNIDPIWEFFRSSFDWMAEMMEKRGLRRPDGVQYPLWAWYQFNGKRKARNVRGDGFGSKGEKLVQLTIEIPDDAVLLSDFDAWAAVYYSSYLAQSEDEYDLWQQKSVDPNREQYGYTAAVRQSWEKIFDVFSEKGAGDQWSFPLKQRTIQACFWALKKEQVIKTTFFTARGRKE